jgi:hypothetical protein
MSDLSTSTPTPSRSPRLARFAANGPVLRSASGRLVTVPVRQALTARDAAAARDARVAARIVPLREAA